MEQLFTDAVTELKALHTTFRPMLGFEAFGSGPR